jgi:hypothetical protein
MGRYQIDLAAIHHVQYTMRESDEVLVVSSGGGGEAVVDGRRLFPLALSTPGGATVQLLFEHQAHGKAWTASVEGMLPQQKLKHPTN